METLGVLADEAHEFISEIGRRTSLSTLMKRHSCTSGSQRQSSVSTQSACLTLSQFPSPHCSRSRHHTLCLMSHTLGMKYQGLKKNNNNNNAMWIFMVLSSWLRAVVRVHPVHLMNAVWVLGVHQPSDQKPTDLGCESANNNWQLPSTSTVIIVTQLVLILQSHWGQKAKST